MRTYRSSILVVENCFTHLLWNDGITHHKSHTIYPSQRVCLGKAVGRKPTNRKRANKNSRLKHIFFCFSFHIQTKAPPKLAPLIKKKSDVLRVVKGQASLNNPSKEKPILSTVLAKKLEYATLSYLSSKNITGVGANVNL